MNGDYKQTNIKNLSSELESYPEPIQQIIDRVFQEYGLIVCGWSGEYDTRLRESLQECETHRYSTYWTYYRDLGDVASELVANRDGFTINHDGAISLFTDLRERVQALDDAEEGEPLTTPIARERVKRYLPREKHRIDLADLISETAQRTRDNIHDEERLPLHEDQLGDGFSFKDRYKEYGKLTRTNVAVTMTCAYWGGDTANSGTKPVSDVLSTLSPSRRPEGRYQNHWNDLRRYPATLTLYGAGLAGIAGDNWGLVSTLLTNPIEISKGLSRQPTEEKPVKALHPQEVLNEWSRGLKREGADETLRTSIKQTLEDPSMDFFVSNNQYERAFEEFEVLLDMLWYSEYAPESVVSLGTTYYGEAINRLEEQVDEEQDDWAPIQTGILNLSIDEVEQILNDLSH